MYNVYKILFLSLMPFYLFSQPYYFNNIYYSESNVWSSVISIIETNEGFLIGGTTGTSLNSYWHQITLSTINDFGEKTDEKLFGDTMSEYYIAKNSFTELNNNAIFLAGSRHTYLPDFPHDEVLIMKLNNNCDSLWTKYFGEKTSPWDTSYVARQLIITSNSELINTGWLTPEVNYQDQIYLLKVDTNGNQLSEWWYSYPGSTWKIRGFSVIETPDKGFAIGAYRFKSGFNYTGEPMVYKVDSLGNEEWFMNVGGPHFDTKSMLCNAYDGNIMEANCFADSMSGDWDAYRTINVKKIDMEGNVIWDKRYAGSEYNKRVSNIRQTNDGGYIITGYTSTTSLYYPYPDRSGWMLKINHEGDSLWYRLYFNITGNDGYNYLYDVIPTSDNGYAACGEVFGPPTNFTQHAWVIKVDSMGCDTPGCSTGTQVIELPANGVSELRVWPNPTTGVFSVQCTEFCVEGEKVIRIYNSQGVKVEEVRLPVNIETMAIDASDYNNGLYFLQLIISNEIQETVKIIKN